MNLRELSDMVYDAMQELGLDPTGEDDQMEAVEITADTQEGFICLTMSHGDDKVCIPLEPATVYLPILH